MSEEFATLRRKFEALEEGIAGRMHVALECHACYDWLFPVLEQFRRAWPEVDVDIRPGLSFGALEEKMAVIEAKFAALEAKLTAA